MVSQEDPAWPQVGCARWFPSAPTVSPLAKGDVQGPGQGADGRCAMDVLFTQAGYISGISSFLCTG